MKHFRLLFLTVVLSAVCATASAQRVTLDMQNAKLEKVLGQITQQTGLVFNYTRPTINPDKRVSVSVKQAELESVLRQLFDADGIVYEIKDGKVYLADRKGGVNPPGLIGGQTAVCRTHRRCCGESGGRRERRHTGIDYGRQLRYRRPFCHRGPRRRGAERVVRRLYAPDHHARSQDDADPERSARTHPSWKRSWWSATAPSAVRW